MTSHIIHPKLLKLFSLSMHQMDNEELHYLLDSSYVDEIYEFSSESVFSYQKEDSISPNTIQYDGILDDDYLERLLQMETELMNIDPINTETKIGDESVEEGIHLGHELNQDQTEQNVDVLIKLAENSEWKGVLEEVLMEESSLTDLLLTGAEAVEAENWPLATTVIAKLNHLLIDQENGDDPFNRLALFFTQGLHFKNINGAPQVSLLQNEPVCTRRQTTNDMSAYQMLQELSPYVKFAHFTANQAILEATQGDQEVHVIDFDIMEGIQWPPLMVDLASRKGASLRITAVMVSHQQNSSVVQQTGRRLKEFADSINLPFVFDQLVMVREEDIERIEVGHTVIANCMIHQFHMPNRSFSLIKTFLGGVTKLSPKIVVLVEEELFSSAKTPSMSFVEFFCEAIHHYTALSDSLISSCDGYKRGIRLIEKELLGVKILDSVRQFPSEKNENKFWGDGFSLLKGFQAIPMSFYNVSQARFLASLFSGEYWVQHERCRLALCWKSRPLTTASIWVPISKPR